jgi:hypothetical protein
VAVNLNAMLSQWKMARKYGTAGDMVKLALSARRERFWLCRIRGQHQEKFGSHGACYRCLRPMR